jgi:hypothetical protein
MGTSVRQLASLRKSNYGKPMAEDFDDAAVLELLRSAAESRRRTASAMLNAYAADALPKEATPDDIAFWEAELADAELEIRRLSN